jgi:hypothetical protein
MALCAVCGYRNFTETFASGEKHQNAGYSCKRRSRIIEWVEAMFLEIAIGDTYGAALGYAKPTADRSNDFSRYSQHPRQSIQLGAI